MGQTLNEIAQTLKNSTNKLQLIYAFNGSGKTRLSGEFKELVAPKNPEIDDEERKIKVMYYNAFTEDLFYWNNDLDYDTDRRLIIQPNNYTSWILVEQGQESNIAKHFQRYTNDKLTPKFNEEYTVKDQENKDVKIPAYSEVRFSFERGNEEPSQFVKISKGEESCFVWSVFYSLLEQTIDVLNVAEKSERETDQFDDLQYVFIDDPVSSLDDSHLIELAVDVAELIKASESELKFIITTHNPLFYNVLYNEFNREKKTQKLRLEKLNDGTFSLGQQPGDSPFSYHLFLFNTLERVTQTPRDIQKYHYNFLRNILEKTSTFLGYNHWEELLPVESREAYYKRIINLCSHSKHHGEETSLVEENDRNVLIYLVSQIRDKYSFKSLVNNSEPYQNVTV